MKTFLLVLLVLSISLHTIFFFTDVSPEAFPVEEKEILVERAYFLGYEEGYHKASQDLAEM